MVTKKVFATLVLAAFWSVVALNQAAAQETTKTEKASKKGHEGQMKPTDKCAPAAFELHDEGKKQGYVCREAKTCAKACNLWRSRKETSAAEFVEKQGTWREVTTEQRRNFQYYCTCEDAKK